MAEAPKEMSLEELAAADGADGRPLYIAWRGRVFDVSQSPLWESGLHMATHQAAADLTAELADAPHGEEVLERFPQVGVLREGAGRTPEEPLAETPPREESWLLRKFPILKRHPHPMLVHFPIVFNVAAPAFTVLYLLTGLHAFDDTALNCLGGGLLFTPLAIATGVITWRLNYEGRPLSPVLFKMILAPVLLIVDAVTFTWRLLVPGILAPARGGLSLLYLLLVLALVPLAVAVGWYGAKLTFPLHEERDGPA